MPDAAPRIAQVLFLDIAGYSKGTTGAQSGLVAGLTESVRSTQAFKSAEAQQRVLALPTGDGMALVFFEDLFAAPNCAIELAKSTRNIPLRMGLHSGLIQLQTDVNGATNVVGEGINVAQRVMDFADPGQILVSEAYAAVLKQFDAWAPLLSPVGEATAKHGLQLSLYTLASDDFGLKSAPTKLAKADLATIAGGLSPQRVVIVYKRGAEPDQTLLAYLETALGTLGHEVFVDRHLKIGVEWAKAIEEKLRAADVVIALLSDAAAGSEMLEYELDIALAQAATTGKPILLPVRVGSERPLDGPVGAMVNSLNFITWFGPDENPHLLKALLASIQVPEKPKDEVVLEPVGGAVPPDSPFYIQRATDGEFTAAVEHRESIILVKGPRQIGKTSLIGRGAKLAKELGYRIVVTDFQKLSLSQLADENSFYRLLSATLAKRIEFKYDFEAEWLDVFGANLNMDTFVRSALEASERPLVWFMDEGDKLFGAPYASDFFGLVRSWHNSRATEPDGPWSRFIVVIAYATEAHLFIQDLNQSPFNVGRQLNLRGFTLPETAELNRRYGSPIDAGAQLEALHALVAGQPFLTRRAMDVVARGAMSFPELQRHADEDDGPFGDHLKRILVSISQLPGVAETVKAVAKGSAAPDGEALNRLLVAGVVELGPDKTARLSCELYRRYLTRHFN
jgi:hypothetical protein